MNECTTAKIGDRGTVGGWVWVKSGPAGHKRAQQVHPQTVSRCNKSSAASSSNYGHGGFHFRFARGFATLRVVSMKSRATGLTHYADR
jgi:hypothetical protein